MYFKRQLVAALVKCDIFNPLYIPKDVLSKCLKPILAYLFYKMYFKRQLVAAKRCFKHLLKTNIIILCLYDMLYGQLVAAW